MKVKSRDFFKTSNGLIMDIFIGYNMFNSLPALPYVVIVAYMMGCCTLYVLYYSRDHNYLCCTLISRHRTFT